MDSAGRRFYADAWLFSPFQASGSVWQSLSHLINQLSQRRGDIDLFELGKPGERAEGSLQARGWIRVEIYKDDSATANLAKAAAPATQVLPAHIDAQTPE